MKYGMDFLIVAFPILLFGDLWGISGVYVNWAFSHFCNHFNWRVHSDVTLLINCLLVCDCNSFESCFSSVAEW